IRYQRAHRRGHVSFAGEGSANPVSDTAHLSHTAPNIGNSQSPDHGVIVAAKDQIGIGQVAPLIFGISLEPAAERTAREIVRWPGRLPRYKEAAARLRQGSPLGEVSAVRWTQSDPLAGNRRRAFVGTDGSKERHGGVG